MTINSGQLISPPGAITPIRNDKLVGEHHVHTRCRFCRAEALHPFLDFGLTPLAGGFLPAHAALNNYQSERWYPLRACVCRSCFLVQTDTVISADTLFRNYFYYSSSIRTLSQHFHDYASALAQEFHDQTRTAIVEIGCNDGVMLKPLKAAGFTVIGVDPARNVVLPLIRAGFDIENAFFGESIAHTIVRRHGQVDVIVAFNSLAHIDDMHDVMRGVCTLLKPDGILIIEVHDLMVLLQHNQYDMIYHEHVNYYSLAALEPFLAQFDMVVYDATPIPIHGGSVRYRIQHGRTGTRPISPSVEHQRQAEDRYGITCLAMYDRFRIRVEKSRQQLITLLDAHRSEGHRIFGYGASGRGTIMSAFCGLDHRYLEAVIDDAPAKQGARMPGTHLPITSSDVMRISQRPVVILVFAWTFLDEIRKRHPTFLTHGGQFIVPLPDVYSIPRDVIPSAPSRSS